jgi:putative DNA primase/helicase
MLGSALHAHGGIVPVIQTVEEIEASVSEPVLDEHATETQLARILASKVPPLRCIGEDWFVYRDGIWERTSRNEFKPLALSIQDERTRSVRKAMEVLKHVEFSNQTSGKEFRSFHFENANGEIIINSANCVLAVSADSTRSLPHSKDYFFTRKTAAAYNQAATSPFFDSALESAIPDASDIDLIRCFSGYVLMPDCRYEVALICYGDSDTAKSTVSTGIEAALGPDLVTKCSLAQISNPESKNLAKLATAALNLSTELNAIEVGSENFKMLVSGESIDADRKYRDSITLNSTCKLWFNANHLPKFKSGTDAELKRLSFIRFANKVLIRDERIKESIKREADGVFLFMIAGLRVLMNNRRMPNASDKSCETKTRFKLQNDPVAAFIETDCVMGGQFEIVKDQLYSAYDTFGKSNGVWCHEERAFFKELYARYPDLKSVRTRDGDLRSQKVRGIDLYTDNGVS